MVRERAAAFGSVLGTRVHLHLLDARLTERVYHVRSAINGIANPRAYSDGLSVLIAASNQEDAASSPAVIFYQQERSTAS